MKASNPPPGPDDRSLEDPSLVSEMLARAILDGDERADAAPAATPTIEEAANEAGQGEAAPETSAGPDEPVSSRGWESDPTTESSHGVADDGSHQPGPADPDASDDDDDDDEASSGLRTAIEWIAVIAGALVVALLIKTFLLQAFYIPSESMEPTLEVGDRVLVNKLSYDFHDVNRGDLVVFHRPDTDVANDDAIKDLIKRVIGLPGETVEAIDGQVYIDGQPLEEPYLADGVTTIMPGPVTVPDGEVFVMGDNRLNSSDSRVFGPISEDLIIGRAFLRVWPLSQIGFL